jgi:capsular polysaccharide biosynthesis protein
MTITEYAVLQKRCEELEKGYHYVLDKLEEKINIISQKNQEIMELKYQKKGNAESQETAA